MPEGGKTRRVYLLLRDAIARGDPAPGRRLPGEQPLAVRFGVSRVTVRRALDALVADGLVQRRAGAGTFVRDAAGETGAMAVDFATLIPQLVEMERTAARLLSFAYEPAPPSVARAMGLDDGDRVQVATRVRLIGDRPFSHLTTYVPEAIAAGYTESDLATQPLFRLLERSGVRVRDAHQSVTAALAGPDVARALQVAEGSALLSLRRVVRDARGRGVEYLAALYRADLFRLEMTLTRVGEDGDRQWQPVIAAPDRTEAAE